MYVTILEMAGAALCLLRALTNALLFRLLLEIYMHINFRLLHILGS